MSIFEKASRVGLRFWTCKGNLSVEDLWKLPLVNDNGPNLDDIYKAVNKVVKSSDVEESLIVKVDKGETLDQLRLEIVTHIIKTRLAEDAAIKVEQENANKKQRILQIIKGKQEKEFEGQSIDELLEIANSL